MSQLRNLKRIAEVQTEIPHGLDHKLHRVSTTQGMKLNDLLRSSGLFQTVFRLRRLQRNPRFLQSPSCKGHPFLATDVLRSAQTEKERKAS